MKILTTSVLALTLATGTSYASGTKQPDPFTAEVFERSGTKQPDPIRGTIVQSSGTKQPDPLIVLTQSSGTKQPDPTSGIVATDSGASTLSHILSKYFGF